MKLLAIDHRLCPEETVRRSINNQHHELVQVYAAEPTQIASAPDGRQYRIGSDGVAVITLRGFMSKSYYHYPEEDSTLRVRMGLAQAQADPNVSRILLVVDSPGGHVDGTDELGSDVRNSTKPVVAYCEDLCASAGYYVASQASQVFANESAIVGSIGTLAYVVDQAEYWASHGIKWIRVATSPAKGAPGIGDEVTEESLRPLRSVVDALGELFFTAVKRGRSMSAAEIKAVTTGEYWIAREALGLGLIDGVQSYERTLDGVRRAAAADRKKSSNNRRMRQTRAACGVPRGVSLREISQQAGLPPHRVRRALAKLGITPVSLQSSGGRPAAHYPTTAVQAVSDYCARTF